MWRSRSQIALQYLLLLFVRISRKRALKPSAWFTIKSRLIPALTKVFVNICTDDAIPPPPTRSERSLKSITFVKDVKDLGDYYIPLVLSDVRDDTDRGWSRLPV
jgi:hypothetical protein